MKVKQIINRWTSGRSGEDDKEEAERMTRKKRRR
jgi:hypothetical protein